MKRTPLIAAAVVLVVASSAVIATAHDRGGKDRPRGEGRAEMMFERFDLNADGQVTRDEVTAAAAQHFADADADGDGQLTAEELASAAEARQSERRGNRAANHVERMLERHDANDDGSLSLEEMTQGDGENRMDRMFEHLDADEDGVITKAELDEMKGMRGNGRGHKRHAQGNN